MLAMKKLITNWFPNSQLDFILDWVNAILPFIRVLMLVLVGYLAWVLIKKSTSKFVNYFDTTANTLEEKKRTRTLMRLLNNLGVTLICAVIFLQSLSEFGFSLAPILATAGVAGLIVALGVQNIAKDVAAGLLLLVEGQIREGDVVEILGRTGTVEEIKLRFIRLRDIGGIVHYVPSSSIGVISNHTKYYSYALIDLDLDANQPYDAAILAISQASHSISTNPTYQSHILDKLEILGLEKLANDAMTIRFRIKVYEHQANIIRRALLMEVKKQFELAGITLASSKPILERESIPNK